MDSFGKRPSGIFKGNTIWAGEYSQCVGIKQNDWNGKYCYINKDKLILFDNYETIFVILNFFSIIYNIFITL